MKIDNYSERAAQNGMVAGYCSTWIREPDAAGDIVKRGAFAASIAAIEREGRTIPFMFNHDSGNIRSYIGIVTYLAEDDHGLFFEAVFDDTEEAQRVRALVKDGRLSKFSFAYDVLDQDSVRLPDGRKVNELRMLDLKEISIVMYPANRDTSVTDVKKRLLLAQANALLNSVSKTKVTEVKKLLREADALLGK